MGSLRVRPLQVLGIAGALLLAPAPAGASTVTVVNNEIQITGAPLEVNVIGVAQGNGNAWIVTYSAGATAGTGCSTSTATSVSCNVGALQGVRATLGDQDDSLDMGLTSVPLDVLGGDGDDTITGGVRSDQIDGQGGDDVLDGGVHVPGGSVLADVLSGGPGVDTVSYANRTNPVRVDVDGGYDDGETGEFDNVGTDVERILGGSGNDTLLGRDGPDELRGGAGNDLIDGRDGDDALFGEAGDDVIDGRVGTDAIDGGAGLDALTSRDSGVADTVACGADADSVVADREDGLTACETADLPPLAEPAPDPSPEPTPSPSATPTPTPEAPVTTIPAAPAEDDAITDVPPPAVVTVVERSVVLARGATEFAVTVSCGADQPGDCTGTVKVTADVPAAASKKASASRRGRRMKSVGVGSAKFRIKKGKSRVVKAKVSRRGVTQALRSARTTRTARGPVKRIKARMTIALRSADGSETTIKRPFAVEVPGAAR